MGIFLHAFSMSYVRYTVSGCCQLSVYALILYKYVYPSPRGEPKSINNHKIRNFPSRWIFIVGHKVRRHIVSIVCLFSYAVHPNSWFCFHANTVHETALRTGIFHFILFFRQSGFDFFGYGFDMFMLWTRLLGSDASVPVLFSLSIACRVLFGSRTIQIMSWRFVGLHQRWRQLLDGRPLLIISIIINRNNTLLIMADRHIGIVEEHIPEKSDFQWPQFSRPLSREFQIW